MANTGYMDDGQYTTHSSLSIVASRASVVAQDIVGTSQITSPAVNVGAGTALAPSMAFQSESSLGFYRSAASIAALSYGFLSAPQFISSQTTAQSASSAKVTNQGQIVFSILSLTTNGAAMYYRSGNSVYGWPSSLVVG